MTIDGDDREVTAGMTAIAPAGAVRGVAATTRASMGPGPGCPRASSDPSCAGVAMPGSPPCRSASTTSHPLRPIHVGLLELAWSVGLVLSRSRSRHDLRRASRS